MQLEEEEAKDTFDVDVAVTNPEKVGQFTPIHFSLHNVSHYQSSTIKLNVYLCFNNVLNNAIIPFHHYNWKLYLFLSAGDGMHAFMAYRVSTKVCGFTLIRIQFLLWPDYTM